VPASSTISLFGASPSTGNQGVNALCWSTLDGLFRRGHRDLHVFDYGQGTRVADFGPVPHTLHGLTVGKRLWRSNHLGVSRLKAAFGLRGSGLANVVSNSAAVLDISGGDSFTDLYGAARFRNITATKDIALRLGKPLVLLPQTYGPFKSRSSRDTARRLISQSTLAYARDPDSFDRLQQLLGSEFDPERHRMGVDVAFGLPTRPPAALEEAIDAFIHTDDPSPLIGLNVSGLVFNQQEEARDRFDLSLSYPELMIELVTRLLRDTDARILLLPHVHAPLGHYESDLDASYKLLQRLPAAYASMANSRIEVVTAPLDACELKWLISKCDWFCGTRMHATIASLSSGVPTAALAYSLKTRGVFKTCESENAVVDLRSVAIDEAVDELMNRWQLRTSDASALLQSLPGVKARAAQQMNEVAESIDRHWVGEELCGAK